MHMCQTNSQKSEFGISVAANQQHEISGATNYAPFNQLALSSPS